MAATENSINDGNFPWDMLKADCLRLICVQLGRRSAVPARREEMLTFLQDVSKNGYATLEELESSPSRFKASQKSLGEEPITPTTRKRTRQDDEEEDVHEEGETPGYNTRHKGAKRVRVSDPGPGSSSISAPVKRGRGRPRKSDTSVLVKRGRGRPRKSEPIAAASAPVKRGRGRPRKSDAPTVSAKGPKVVVKRGRGRPRKSDVAQVTDETTSAVKRGRGRPRKASVEDATVPVKYRRGRGHLKESEAPVGGVVKRGRGRPRKNPIVRADGGGKPTFEGVFITPRAMLKAAAGPEEGQDGEDDDGEDEEQLLEDHLLTNPEGDSSNFGGSNKENDPALALQIDELDAEADAEGEADADLILLDAAHASTSV